MKIVGVYPGAFEAELAKGRLEEAGIEVCLLNEYINSVVPYLTPADRAVKLAVADEDYEAAVELLELTEAKETVCPHCGSKEVTLGLRGRKRWAKVFWTVLATLTMSPPGNVEANYYCRSCRKDF